MPAFLFLVRFGEYAHTAQNWLATSAFFWFTFELGVTRSAKGLRVDESGLVSSYGEIEHAIESPAVQRYPMQIESAINQGFEINHDQPRLFIVDLFEHLFGMVCRAG